MILTLNSISSRRTPMILDPIYRVSCATLFSKTDSKISFAWHTIYEGTSFFLQHIFTTALFHYRFDGYFIVKWLIMKGEAPSVIMNGSQFMYLREKKFGIKFRDTLSYVPMSLDNWAKSFGVKVHKGKFPHLINRPEYWNRIVAFPSKEMFGYNVMNDRERHEFLDWYNAEKLAKNNLYNVNMELVEYCIQDVKTLQACTEELFNLFFNITGGLNIFCSGLTIASVCHYFWRARLLKKDLLEVVHATNRRKSSVKCAKWLTYMSNELHIDIKPEYKWGRYFLDGYSIETNTAYEFYGKLCHALN